MKITITKYATFANLKGIYAYEECRKRRYFETQNNSGNAKDPSSNKDATQVNPENHLRLVRLIDQETKTKIESQSSKSEIISRRADNQY
jgi:hypothetical protein